MDDIGKYVYWLDVERRNKRKLKEIYTVMLEALKTGIQTLDKRIERIKKKIMEDDVR